MDELTWDELETAIGIAVLAHKGQRDKHGQAYILHPLRVMFAQGTANPLAMAAGVLHDVVEDTSCTLDDLRVAKLPERLIAAAADRGPL